MSRSLSVILPAYDEAPHIAAHVERLAACLEATGRSFEVLVVDDGSRDGTGEVARAVAARDARVRVLSHDRNLGKGRALATGCAAATGDVLVLLDADLEIPPEDVLPLVGLMEEAGADVAVGSKYHPQATLAWPLHRRALSRLYHLVTALLFRLPLRDTQTGLKAIRRAAAADLVPRLRSRRFAWDLELLLLAHRQGYRFVTGPVHVTPAQRASRVGWRGAMEAGVDTLRIFLRDRGLAAYAPPRPRRPAPTCFVVSGDDLGLTASVDEGLLRGLERGALTSVSVLATSPRVYAAAQGLATRAPAADAGLHLDLLGGRSLARFVGASLRRDLLGRASAADLTTQVSVLREAAVPISHVDAHRHAWCLPWTRRGVLRGVRAAGLDAVRALRPLGPCFGYGVVEAAKRLVLRAMSIPDAGLARAHGLVAPEGWVDARTAAAWVAAGSLPAWTRGRAIEVIAHPAVGADDLPKGERGTLDRVAEARAVLEPPLAEALRALGAEVVDFRTLARGRQAGGCAWTWRHCKRR